MIKVYKNKGLNLSVFRLFVVLLILGLNSVNLNGQNQKPNVLFIVLDDLNDFPNEFGGHPQAITPNIDRLAKEGVVFNNAHSNAPLCNPSRASFLSGVLPRTSGFYGIGNWKQNDVIKNSKLISEYARENGYYTLKAGKIEHSASGTDPFWDEIYAKSHSYGPMAYNGVEYVVHPETVLDYSNNSGPLDATNGRLSNVPNVEATNNTPGYNGWWLDGEPFKYVDDNNRDLMPDEKNAQWIASKIREFESNPDQPFFMALGLVRPHTPCIAPDKYFDMFPLEDIILPPINIKDTVDTYRESGKGELLSSALDRSFVDRQEGLKKRIQAYLASVAFSDDMLGVVLDELEKSSFSDNTIVILTGDHGFHLSQKQYIAKNTLWEESTRVPLIIKSPDYLYNGGQRVNHPVSLIDIYPTITDLCAMQGDTKKNDLGAEIDGHSLREFLIDPNSNSWSGSDFALSSVAEWYFDNPTKQNYALRSERYRYILYKDGKEELYDHLYDEHEWTNIVNRDEYSEVLDFFRVELKNQFYPNLILRDDLVDFSKVFSKSENWKTNYEDAENLVHDPDQIVRTSADEAYLEYKIVNVNDFKVDLWGLKKEDPLNYGFLKAFVAGDDKVYQEVDLEVNQANLKGWRDLYVYSPIAKLPAGSRYIKFELVGGDGSILWKSLLGTIWMYSADPVLGEQNVSIGDILVNVDENIFDIEDGLLRINDAILPELVDPLNDSSLMESITGQYYFTDPTADHSAFEDDNGRLIRQISNQLTWSYSLEDISYFRVEFWTKDGLTDQEIIDQIGLFTASISDDGVSYNEVPVHFTQLRKVGNKKLYALVPKYELYDGASYVKFSLSGGSDMWNGQFGTVYLYRSNFSEIKQSLGVENQVLKFNIFPNPSSDFLYLPDTGEIFYYSIYNLKGQLKVRGSTDSAIEIKDLSEGYYILNIKNKGSVKFTKK